jgi:hypothetical protein
MEIKRSWCVSELVTLPAILFPSEGIDESSFGYKNNKIKKCEQWVREDWRHDYH